MIVAVHVIDGRWDEKLDGHFFPLLGYWLSVLLILLVHWGLVWFLVSALW